ncbi:potassium channel subfamily K member 1 [Dendroctonus ponderosae]
MPLQNTQRFTVFLCGYVLFLCIGASIYLAIEQEEEMRRLVRLQQLKTDFIRRFPCVSYAALEELIWSFQVEGKSGLQVTGNETNWYFGQSVFFVTTVVTTIGYGHITPVTQSGKIFTIILSLIGIPLTLSVFGAFVDRLLLPTTYCLNWLNSKLLGHSCKRFSIRLLHLIALLTFTSVFFLLLPASFFNYMEPEWGLFESFYYCFLSLTTTGLGDFTPGESMKLRYHSNWYLNAYKIGATVYLFLGIIFTMLTLAVFYDIPQLNVGMLYTVNNQTRFSVAILENQAVGRVSDTSKKQVSIAE